MNVIMTRRILPVGQGAFYLERFYNCDGNPSFTMVYDCGAYPGKRYVKREIERNFKKDESVDIVFISHLDADHVNGLMDLLRRCQVKCIVYPLLEDGEYQLAWVKNKINFRDSFSESFLRDAKEAIKQLKLPYELKLIKVKKYERRSEPDPFKTIEIEGDGLKLSNGQDTIESGSRILLHVSKIRGQVDGDLKWLFSPLNYQHDSQLQKFDNLLTAEFGSAFRIKDLPQYWVKSEENQRKIKSAYEKLAGGTNVNSMTLYSGPQSSTDASLLVTRVCSSSCYSCALPWCDQWVQAGCLYTGDYCAAVPENWQALDAWRKQFEDCIGGVQLPHHGSILSFNKKLIREGCVYFASVGETNKHGHPSGKVCEELRLSSKCFHIVTESLTSELDSIVYETLASAS